MHIADSHLGDEGLGWWRTGGDLRRCVPRGLPRRLRSVELEALAPAGHCRRHRDVEALHLRGRHWGRQHWNRQLLLDREAIVLHLSCQQLLLERQPLLLLLALQPSLLLRERLHTLLCLVDALRQLLLDRVALALQPDLLLFELLRVVAQPLVLRKERRSSSRLGCELDG